MEQSNERGPLQLKLFAVNGGIWTLPDASVEPRVSLEKWQVYEIEDGKRHIIGWSPEHREGRATSEIVRFEPTLRICQTRRGRLYELKGEASFDSDAVWVWQSWCQINGVKRATCVTVEFEAAMSQAGDAGSSQ